MESNDDCSWRSSSISSYSSFASDEGSESRSSDSEEVSNTVEPYQFEPAASETAESFQESDSVSGDEGRLSSNKW